jgi:type VI secretion system secreted protein VgrG
MGARELGFSIDQADRLLKLEFDGTLSRSFVPIEFTGREAISQLPRYTVDVVSNELAPAPKDVLGHEVTIIVTDGEITRRFTGMVSRFSPGPLWGRGYRAFQLEVVPKLWLATLNSRCRSFLGKSALDIVHEVLSEYDVKETTRGPGAVTRPTRDYCLQYCESDFAFISRLLEDEGLFYYFPLDHQNENLVLVDGLNGTFEVGGGAEFNVGPHAAVDSWSHDIRTVAQSVKYSGYDLTQASVVSITAQANTTLDYASKASVEIYPSNVIDTPRSQFFAEMHMQALESEYERFKGSGTHAQFAPAGRVSVATDRGSDDKGNYMLLAVDHHATCHTQVSVESTIISEYGNLFYCLPLDRQYRPPRRTPRPFIQGPQTAVVSSDPDQYGRVKVKFHWGEGVESWWTRVATPWAHKQMGLQLIPRTGSEVVVQFLDGVPERPIIIGAVFNGVNQPVYTLPDNKTQSGLRGTDPDSTGTAERFNELQFEDKPGDEFVKMFAQKDYKRVVVNDDSLEIRQGKRAVVIKQGDLTTTLEQGSETRELKMGGFTFTLDQGDETRRLKMGNQSIKLDLGSSSTEAMQSIELKVGQSSLKIDQTGIKLSGMQIQIEGTLSAQMKGPMTTVQGSGMLTLSGGVTMIG